MRRNTPAKEKIEFYSMPEPNSGCWLWTGGSSGYGYGWIWHNGQVTRAHRVAWEAYNDQIPEGMCVLHRCDTPQCVNPEHLFIGTKQDNNDDRSRKGRWRGGRPRKSLKSL